MPRPATVSVVADDPEPAPEPAPARLVSVEHDGHTYTFDADEVTLDALEDFESQRYIRAIRAIIGPDQWAQYKTRHPRAVDLDRFIAALLAAAGAVGNSSASPVS